MIFPGTSSPSHSILATPYLTNQFSRTKPSASTMINYVIGLPSAVNIKKPHLHTPRINSLKTHSTSPLGLSKNKPASEPFHCTPKVETITGRIGLSDGSCTMYADTVTEGTRKRKARTFMTMIIWKAGEGLAVVGAVLEAVHLVSTSL